VKHKRHLLDAFRQPGFWFVDEIEELLLKNKSADKPSSPIKGAPSPKKLTFGGITSPSTKPQTNFKQLGFVSDIEALENNEKI
jgi:hypothetical protein